MAEKKKSIIEEAALDISKIQEALDTNTKEILRSVGKEEIDDVLKESLKEDDYVEEDVTAPTTENEDEDEVVDVDSEGGDSEEAGEEMPEPEMPSADDNADDMEGSEEAGEEMPEPEVGMDMGVSDYGDEIDMTAASDDEIVAIYKKLSGEDEIEVVGDEIHLTVSEPGEYVVKTGEGAEEAPVAEPEMDAMAEPEMADAVAEPEMGAMAEPEMADAMGDEEVAEPEMADAAGEEDEYDELAESNIVYEIALDEEEVSEVNEETSIGNTANGKPRTATSDVHMGKGESSAPNSGDIEGQTSPVDSETSGDNLSDTGWDDAQNGTGDAHAEHIMNENEETVTEEDEVTENEETVTELETVEETEEIAEEDVAEGEEVDETKYVGGKVARVATSHTNHKLQESDAKYNKVLTQAKKLQEKNDEYKKALKQFRTMLAETVVFNTNLTYVTKLFMEHSTTKDEKKEILSRFDNEVSTIKESKKLYKSLDKELGKKTISESIDNKINNGPKSSSSTQLNESTAYSDPSTSRIMDLISRVEKR